MHAAQTESCTTIFACLQSLSRRFIRCWDVRRSKRASLRVCTHTGDQFGTRCPFFPSFFKQPHPFLWLTHTHTHTHTHTQGNSCDASVYPHTNPWLPLSRLMPAADTNRQHKTLCQEAISQKRVPQWFVMSRCCEENWQAMFYRDRVNLLPVNW